MEGDDAIRAVLLRAGVVDPLPASVALARQWVELAARLRSSSTQLPAATRPLTVVKRP